MVKRIIDITAGLSASAIVSFLVHQISVSLFNHVADPLSRLFFEHAKAYAEKLGHTKRSPFKCEDCEIPLKNLPN